MNAVVAQGIRSREEAMSDRSAGVGGLEQVVSTPEEFDRVVSQALPILLDRASGCTRRFLRETGQWNDGTAHEKFVLRWSAEYLERFLLCGRSDVPCRPLFLLDSFVAKQHSQPDPFCYHPDLLTPLGRYLDGLVARAVISRDALIALYHHCYGMGPRDVIAVTGLSESESQRIYKNFRRWRDSGWRRIMDEIGMSDAELDELIIQQQRHRQRFNHETEQIMARRYNAAGTALGNEFQVSTNGVGTNFEVTRPDLAMDANGDFVVVFTANTTQGGDDSDFSVHGKRYRADGTELGTQFLVNSYTTNRQFLPTVASDPEGDFLVAWQSAGSPGGDASFTSIQAQRFQNLFADGFETADTSRWSAIVP